ncbi:MAG: DUF998 domain-containing protein [Salinibacterium sp.]|nr:DUF998 domain-containing protein [Salinibacterium sp.]
MSNSRPATAVDSRSLAIVALIGLGGGLLGLGTAPVVMPEDYSWVTNSISESGAQQLPGAWLARSGFLLFGLGAVLTAIVRARVWRWGAVYLLAAFGVLLICCAAFSTRQWVSDAPFDPTENVLHSLAATVMGFCYGIGVLLVVILDRTMMPAQRVLGYVAVTSSVVLPISVGLVPSLGGVLQRLMFAIAFAWFIIEAVRGRRSASY